ncbi:MULTISPECIES: hypothetical protein [Bacillus]|uniref:Uncharacterized protein n=2 Tax=Bacillus thuringiensis TaxID=1428 RepID=A0AAP4Q6F3_BACTU|nr:MULTISPECIES: hypothetical protein [Bacillus]MEC0048472.1 hypothetical protein [Bacillus cereus]AFV21940.1 hypothetical protein BTB_502p06350 [Bacillus thuringiensis Bt407]EEM25037.1 hypothetical protein bthur0002_56790 [Bacillus thuringiensis Bt407]ERI00882.1 hypothetical protein BTCBT_002437 [Bacillus thuringiensis T01-328]MBN6707655.1 hypothetical protein [Bacillus thuringiensis]
MVYAKNRNSDVVGHLTPSSFGYSVHYKTFKNGEYTRCKTLGMSVKELIENWIIIHNYKQLYNMVKGFKKDERIRIWFKDVSGKFIAKLNCNYTGQLVKSGFISRDGEVWSETKDNRNMIRNHAILVNSNGIETWLNLMKNVVYVESLDNVPSVIPSDENSHGGKEAYLPDIDSDFEEVDASKVIKYIKEKYPVSV